MRHYVKFNAECGITLLVVLVFMQILALLSWYAIEAAWLETKMGRHFWQHQKAYHLAEQVLSQAERSSGCLMTTLSTASLTCTGNFQQFKYYYVVEFLGNDPCGQIENAAADYFRITLFGSMNDEKISLQSTIVKPSYLGGECVGAHYQSRVGRQSWKEITFG